MLSEGLGMDFFMSALLINFGFNIVDKGFSSFMAYMGLVYIPEDVKKRMWNLGWKQKPITEAEIKEYKKESYAAGKSLNARMTIMLIVASASMAGLMAFCGIQLYFRDLKKEYAQDAIKASEFVAENIDGDLIKGFLSDGEYISEYENQKYKDINNLLISYHESLSDIEYLYVYQIRPDGCRLVFDTDPEVQNTEKIGTMIPFDEMFEPYVPALINGEKIDVVEVHSRYGYFLTAYTPIYDSKGRCVAYAGADASLEYMTEYIRDFILQVLLVFFGFLILIIAVGLWFTAYSLVFPVKSMASFTGRFMKRQVSQDELDESVKQLRSLNIRTGDEIEALYQSICRMASGMAEQMRNIRYYTESASTMQNGLIITLADIVENRDSDTGAHIQKTAAYVRIVLEGLRRKGYYLEKITDDDSFVLGVNPEVARPEWLVLTVLPVPPVTVRPSITLDTGERSEDDLTHKLVDILRINQRLLENMEAGAPQLIVEDLWELLQYHVTTYFDNEASGVPPARHRSGRPLKTLTQRLKGKEGRFRSNLSGKRVNFSARTVISPDPNISINEVGVPEMIAKEVTVPVYVNEWNMDEMIRYIENGPDVHPGANYVIRKDGRKIRVRNEETKELILEQLEPGFIIERHLKDGDMVLFNRQPSLHRMSMMAHEVRVLPYKTFRLNLCVCPPYNADFDGDEMNMHVFQTDESRAEAKSLMRVQEHILSPRFGGPIIGAIHDHISGAYLLTRDGVEFTEEQALQIIRKSHLKLPTLKGGQWVLKEDPDYPEESYIYKDEGAMWTGKELFSLLLPNDLNLSYSAEISKCPVVYPAEDATVVIKDGILVQGVIDESAYGSFSGKILDKIVKEYGPGRAKEFLDRSTDLAICGIMKTGITTSLNDEEIPEEAQDRINEHLDKKMAEVDKLVESYEEGYLQALPGRSLEETLEMKIMQVLGEARDMSGSIAENYLTMGKQSDDDPYDHVMAVENHSVVMARTGARASMLNLTQITACVGQQAVRGGRIERGYLNRTLPHFKKGELGAKAKGFVHSSYKSGLDPIEFFFHAMGGREGLVDTAIRTAQSGYMQRRLVNALQDLQVKPSGLVTDNQGNVIQTMFGEDGVDPAKSDFGKPADLNKLIDEIRMESMAGK